MPLPLAQLILVLVTQGPEYVQGVTTLLSRLLAEGRTELTPAEQLWCDQVTARLTSNYQRLYGTLPPGV